MESNRCEYKRELSDGLERKPLGLGRTGLTYFEAQVEVQVEAQVDIDILKACALRPLSSREIATVLGHKQLSGNMRKALPRLKNTGLLEYTIPDKPNSRLQKYRLTTKGQALLGGGRYE
jgi:hypothetical protein